MERLTGFLTGGEMDRLLTMPFIISVSGKAAGMTHREKRATAESEAQCQIANYERFGNDLFITEYGLHTVGIELGTEMSDTELAVPHILHHVLENLDDIDSLDFEKALPQNSAHAQKHLGCARILGEQYGTEVPQGTLVPGPFTVASSIYPIDKLLRATRKNPEAVHKLLRLSTDVIKELHNAFIAAGSMILFCEPLATGSIVNPKQFAEFVLPYTKELMANIHDKGGMVCYHICGETQKVLKMMAEAGPDMVSVDERVPMTFAKEVAQDYMPIVGNVDPTNMMMFGTPEEIAEAVKNCVLDSYDAKHGYILATGCDLNVNVPLESIDAFMAAARKYGKLPIDPSQWD